MGFFRSDLAILRKPESLGIVHNPGHPLSRGLYGHWLFNEANGLIVRDIVGGKHAIGTASNITWEIESKLGRLVNLPNTGGSSYRFDVPVINHNIGTGNFTWSAWATRVADNGAAYEGLMAIESGGNAYPGMYFEVNGTSNWGGYFPGTGAMPANTALVVGTLYHLVMRRIGSTVDFWVNGIREATTYTNSDSIPNDISHIGTSLSIYPTNHSNCKVSDVRCYRRALSDAEIVTLFRTPYVDILDTSRRYAGFWIGTSGGTNYPQSISGSLTGSGILVRNTSKIFLGSSAASSSISKATTKSYSGIVSLSGAPIRAITLVPKTGSVSPSGDLGTGGTISQGTAGSLTPTGALSFTVQFFRTYGSSITMVGTYVRAISITLGGVLAAQGSVLKNTFKSFAGSFTLSSVLGSFKFTPTSGGFFSSSLRAIRRFLGRR